jgi:hypothetical protein
MGCKPSKIRTNLTSDQPSQIIGSTQLQADQIVVLGDSVFLPVSNPDGKSAIIEVMVNDKKIHVYRGYKDTMTRAGLI